HRVAHAVSSGAHLPTLVQLPPRGPTALSSRAGTPAHRNAPPPQTQSAGATSTRRPSQDAWGAPPLAGPARGRSLGSRESTPPWVVARVRHRRGEPASIEAQHVAPRRAANRLRSESASAGLCVVHRTLTSEIDINTSFV